MDLLVVGLGNPGSDHVRDRHNVGFLVLDLLAERLQVRFRKPLFRRYLSAHQKAREGKLILIKPLTWMNRSGEIMPSLLEQFHARPDQILLVLDNLDLPPGTIRLKRRGSSSGHNGLASVIHHLETDEFPRIYVGIGRPGSREQIVEHVLSPPVVDEEAAYHASFSAAADTILRLFSEPFERVMGDVNRRNPSG